MDSNKSDTEKLQAAYDLFGSKDRLRSLISKQCILLLKKIIWIL